MNRGPTPMRSTAAAHAAVHPRECGGHVRPNSICAPATGSSPRVRGPRHGVGRIRLPRRFIPASAGATPMPCTSSITPSVHPRECGGHVSRATRSQTTDGSSPRVRGPLRLRLIDVPAAAVHPRECGGHNLCLGQGTRGGGSSPRVRGPPAITAGHGIYVRFIPASAGATQSVQRARHRDAVHPRECGGHDPIPEEARNGVGSSPRVRGPRPRRPG